MWRSTISSWIGTFLIFFASFQRFVAWKRRYFMDEHFISLLMILTIPHINMISCWYQEILLIESHFWLWHVCKPRTCNKGTLFLIKQRPVNIGQCVEAGHGLQTPDLHHLFTARWHYEVCILEQTWVKGHNVNKTFTKNVFPQLELSNELVVGVDWG